MVTSVKKQTFSEFIKDFFWENRDLEEYLKNLSDEDFKNFIIDLRDSQMDFGLKDVVRYSIYECLGEYVGRHNRRIGILKAEYPKMYADYLNWLIRRNKISENKKLK